MTSDALLTWKSAIPKFENLRYDMPWLAGV
jgi:hypothetical protein